MSLSDVSLGPGEMSALPGGHSTRGSQRGGLKRTLLITSTPRIPSSLFLLITEASGL